MPCLCYLCQVVQCGCGQYSRCICKIANEHCIVVDDGFSAHFDFILHSMLLNVCMIFFWIHFIISAQGFEMQIMFGCITQFRCFHLFAILYIEAFLSQIFHHICRIKDLLLAHTSPMNSDVLWHCITALHALQYSRAWLKSKYFAFIFVFSQCFTICIKCIFATLVCFIIIQRHQVCLRHLHKWFKHRGCFVGVLQQLFEQLRLLQFFECFIKRFFWQLQIYCICCHALHEIFKMNILN